VKANFTFNYFFSLVGGLKSYLKQVRVWENSAVIAFARSKLHMKEVILAQGYIR